MRSSMVGLVPLLGGVILLSFMWMGTVYSNQHDESSLVLLEKNQNSLVSIRSSTRNLESTNDNVDKSEAWFGDDDDDSMIVLMRDGDKIGSEDESLERSHGVRLTQETNGNLAVYQGTQLLWETGIVSSSSSSSLDQEKDGDEQDGTYYYVTSLQRGDGNLITWKKKKQDDHVDRKDKGVAVVWKTQKVTGETDDYFLALSRHFQTISVYRGTPTHILQELWKAPTTRSSTILMHTNQRLAAGNSIQLAPFDVQLTQESNGNLKLCHVSSSTSTSITTGTTTTTMCDRVLWESGYKGPDSPHYQTILQSDGHFLTRNEERNTVWKSKHFAKTKGTYVLTYLPKSSTLAVFERTAQLQLQPIWSSNKYATLPNQQQSSSSQKQRHSHILSTD